MNEGYVWSAACFSDDRAYRYTLRRNFLIGEGTVGFVMLNPSTADETDDDPTVARCVSFALRWGYSALHTSLTYSGTALPIPMRSAPSQTL